MATHFDDEGNLRPHEVSTLNFQDVTLSKRGESIVLRVENAGRSLKELFFNLEQTVGMGFYAEPILFTNTKPQILFDNVDQSRLVGLKLVGAVVGNDAVGRIELASKNGIIVDELPILRDIRYKTDTAIFDISFKGTRGQVSFKANGLVKLSGQLAPKLLELVEAELGIPAR